MMKAVVFDLDDTLISEREYVFSGFRHLSKQLGNLLGRDETEIYNLFQELFTNSPKNIFNRMLDRYDYAYTDQLIRQCVADYRNHIPDIRFYQDVAPCLAHLKALGIKTGVITDGYANAQRNKLNVLCAYEHFDEIIITDELGRDYWKPHARAFELMSERLDIDFSEIVYVGDNPAKDFFIRSILPIRTIRINRGGIHTDNDYLGGIREHQLIHSLDEIDKIVKMDDFVLY